MNASADLEPGAAASGGGPPMREGTLLALARAVSPVDGRRDVRAIANALCIAHPVAAALARTLSVEDQGDSAAPDAAAPGRRRLSWTPAPETLRRMLAWFTGGGGLIGLIGFAASFASVSQAAYPYMGRGAFTLPLLVDLGIFVLTGLAIVLELHEISSRWIRLIPNALALFTVYLNTATQHQWFGKAVHAAGPALWVIVVEIATFTVRRMVALSSENTIGKVRGSRWVLSPLSTLRLWRRMRLWEITDYRTAISREHERAASVALLRQWYGAAWRGKAPRAERLAVRLQGATDEPVADLLARASGGISAAALAAAKPVAGDTDQSSAPGSAPEPGMASAPRRTSRGQSARTRQVQLLARAQRINAKVSAKTGAPVSARQLARALGVGQDTARALVKQFPGAVQIEHANGTAVL